MQWFLWGCVVVGAMQAIEAVRLMRNGGQLAVQNLWVAGVECIWLIACVVLLLFVDESAGISTSNAERWLALTYIVFLVAITLLAKKLGYYDGMQARIEKANKEQPDSFGLEEMRLQPALVLPSVVFGSSFAGAALWILA
jgi:hypothetical protein